MSVRWPGCKWGRWWMDDEECSISNSWSNNISLRKPHKCLDEGVHLVTENSQTYIVHQSDVILGITSLLFITQIHNVPSTRSMDNINASIKCSRSTVEITGNPWHTEYNSKVAHKVVHNEATYKDNVARKYTRTNNLQGYSTLFPGPMGWAYTQDYQQYPKLPCLRVSRVLSRVPRT